MCISQRPFSSRRQAVAADAISRRFGQTLPNSIGAWYNGDISNGNPAGAPIRYLEDSAGFISVVAPDGAVLTPGAPNILRNVYFRLVDQNKEVAEADGSVTHPHRADGRYRERIADGHLFDARFRQCRRRRRLHGRDRYRNVQPW